jgi:hypothetical protein
LIDNTYIFIEERVTVYEDENGSQPPGYSKKYTALLTLNTNFEIFLQRNVNIIVYFMKAYGIYELLPLTKKRMITESHPLTNAFSSQYFTVEIRRN